VIGNDLVDLALAQKESNWKRRGFLDKIFTKKEQSYINYAENSEVMVWNLWSRKEAAYKIYNRETKIRGYFPLQLECVCESLNLGTVSIKGKTYFTQTKIENDRIHTIAVAEKTQLKQFKTLNSDIEISKKKGLPFIIDLDTKKEIPVSISHHGRFWAGVSLI
jgi:phosphopantetheinyl transferase (holo-ACP synthase)